MKGRGGGVQLLRFPAVLQLHVHTGKEEEWSMQDRSVSDNTQQSCSSPCTLLKNEHRTKEGLGGP